MSIFPNGGSNVASVTANGTSITGTVYMNGVAVWTGTVAQTDYPSITADDIKKFRLTMRFTNNDASTATIYADIGQAVPTTNRGDIASGAYVDITFNGLDAGTTYDFYAKAQASGKTLSLTAHATQSTS